MPTAVTQLELAGRNGFVSVPQGYDRALVLLRWDGRPVGSVVLPVKNGIIDAQVVETRLIEWASWDFWSVFVNDSLGWDESELTGPRPAATVAVCTRDRPRELERCIQAIMSLPDAGQEVIVVDNNSTGTATAEVVARFAGVRYLKQSFGGLNAARNCALREALHPVVAFTDDDAVVDAGWLAALLRNFRDPRVLCVTGLTMPAELETDAQEWFEAFSPFGRGFKRRIFDGHDMNPAAVGPVGAGANVAFRREVIDSIGEFDEALDAGTPTRSGGDHDMFSRVLASGYRIVYEPAALNWHTHRRSYEQLRETLEGYGTGVYAMWTAALLRNRELGVLKQAGAWLLRGQLPELFRSVRASSGRVPPALLLAELRGCLRGPLAYFASRHALNRRRQSGQLRDSQSPAGSGA